jgi:hypothetical protein
MQSPARISKGQVLESVIWIALGLGMIKAIADFGQEAWFNNTILLFSMPLPGPLLGLACAALLIPRRFALAAHLGLRLLCAASGFLVWLPILWLWGPAAR